MAVEVHEIHFRTDDLRTIGVNHLTGEANGVWGMYRGLYDLTEDGVKVVEAFFGSTVEVRPKSNWNPGAQTDPAVGSIMLPTSVMQDLHIFGLLHLRKYGCIIRGTLKEGDREKRWPMPDDIVFGFVSFDEYQEWCETEEGVYWNERYSFQRVFFAGTAGSRNTHAMSGRVA